MRKAREKGCEHAGRGGGAFGKSACKARSVVAMTVLNKERWSRALGSGANELIVLLRRGQGVAGPPEILEPRDQFTKAAPSGWPSTGSISGTDPETWEHCCGPLDLSLIFPLHLLPP